MLRLLQGIYSLLTSTLPVHSPVFFQNLSRFFLCWLWLTHVPCVGYPQNINRLKNMTCGMMTCEMNQLEIE